MYPQILQKKIESAIYALCSFFIAWIPDYQGEVLRLFFSVGGAVSSWLIIESLKRYFAKKKIMERRKKNETN